MNVNGGTDQLHYQQMVEVQGEAGRQATTSEVLQRCEAWSNRCHGIPRRWGRTRSR